MPDGHPPQCAPKEPLRVNVLFEHIQKMLSSDTAVIVETGDEIELRRTSVLLYT